MKQTLPRCVSAILVDNEIRVWVILQTLAHLLPIPRTRFPNKKSSSITKTTKRTLSLGYRLKSIHLRSKHQTGRDQIFPRCRPKQVCRQHQQRVEPPSCLVNTLGDKICRERAVELLLVLEWIMLLCIRHAVVDVTHTRVVRTYTHAVRLSMELGRTNTTLS